MFDTDEVMSFLPLCHVFEQLFSVIGHITHGYVVNFIESPDTVTDNMIEISPTVGYAVPRIWEKYYSAICIKMSDATWFKRLVFYRALKIGQKRATLKMNFKKVPLYSGVLVPARLFCRFPKAEGKTRLRPHADRLLRGRPDLAGRAPFLPVHRGQSHRRLRPDRRHRGHLRFPGGQVPSSGPWARLSRARR